MTQKVFITGENMATFVCPKCEKTRTVDISRYQGLDQAARVKAKCACGHSYSVILERRRQYRKEVNFSGAYTRKKTGEKGTMVVKDISRTGLKIKLNLNRDIEIGEKLVTEFSLDDRQRTQIEKEAIVRKRYRDTLGVEFTSVDPSNAYDKALGFYMFG